MTTIGWARRLQGSGVVANVVHPGVVATNLVRAGGLIGLGWRLKTRFALTEEQGADSPLHVALADAYGAISGAYVKRRQVVRPNRLALDERLLSEVWEATEALVPPSAMGAALCSHATGLRQSG
jgi:NAD(P)-dependent dehydrogenase (short-subunit alcohol dehydrogenase family)